MRMTWKMAMKRNHIYFLCTLLLAATAVVFILGTNFHNRAADVAATPVKQIGAAGDAQGISPNQDSVQKRNESAKHSTGVFPTDPVAGALAKIRSRDVGQRIAGIQELTRLNPPEAVSVLYESLNRLQEEPDIEGMIVLGMLNLTHADQYLTDSDIDYLYHNAVNDNISGRAARILAVRGDDRLLAEHINKFEWRGEGYSTETALKNLKWLGALESGLAVSNITPYLSSDNEEVRLQALLAVSLCANADDVEQLKPLLSDASDEVRARAEAVTRILQVRGKEEPEPIDMAVTSSYGS
jgi:hypothetical protein